MRFRVVRNHAAGNHVLSHTPRKRKHETILVAESEVPLLSTIRCRRESASPWIVQQLHNEQKLAWAPFQPDQHPAPRFTITDPIARLIHSDPTFDPSSRRHLILPLVIGVDEVGRGPLAGPVTVCAYCFPPRAGRSGLVRDSKEVKVKWRRKALAKQLSTIPGALYEIASVGPARIDETDILRATLECMTIAVERLLAQLARRWSSIASYYVDNTDEQVQTVEQPSEALATSSTAVRTATTTLPCCQILIDGNHIPDRLIRLRGRRFQVESIIKGDAKIYDISAASLIAKNDRDTYMEEKSKEYPIYGWDRNSGYGVAKHIAAIQRYGLAPIHRREKFTKKFLPQQAENEPEEEEEAEEQIATVAEEI